MTDTDLTSPQIVRRAQLALTAGVFVLLVLYTLHLAAVVAVPIVFAFFLATVLAPLDRRISGALPSWLGWLGKAGVLAILLIGLAVFFGGLVVAARQVMDEVPQIVAKLEQFLPESMPAMTEIERMIGDSGPTAPPAGTEDGTSPLRSTLNQAGSTAGTWLIEGATGLAQRIVGAAGTFTAATIIVVFMVLLALSESGTWQRKLGSLWPEGNADWQNAIATTSRKLRAFLLVRAAMGALTAALYVLLLWIFDIGLLPVWAILTFLLGFVPNLGSVISGILPTLYALVTKDLQTALLAGAGLFAIEQVIGNWVDPRLQGRQISISPVVILIAILVWGWIWGAAGALLAVPVTVAILVACAHVPALEPVALLLSNQCDREGLKQAMEA